MDALSVRTGPFGKAGTPSVSPAENVALPSNRTHEDRSAAPRVELLATYEQDARLDLNLNGATFYTFVKTDVTRCPTTGNAGSEVITVFPEAEILRGSGEAIYNADDPRPPERSRMLRAFAPAQEGWSWTTVAKDRNAASAWLDAA